MRDCAFCWEVTQYHIYDLEIQSAVYNSQLDLSYDFRSANHSEWIFQSAGYAYRNRIQFDVQLEEKNLFAKIVHLLFQAASHTLVTKDRPVKDLHISSGGTAR